MHHLCECHENGWKFVQPSLDYYATNKRVTLGGCCNIFIREEGERYVLNRTQEFLRNRPPLSILIQSPIKRRPPPLPECVIHLNRNKKRYNNYQREANRKKNFTAKTEIRKDVELLRQRCIATAIHKKKKEAYVA